MRRFANLSQAVNRTGASVPLASSMTKTLRNQRPPCCFSVAQPLALMKGETERSGWLCLLGLEVSGRGHTPPSWGGVCLPEHICLEPGVERNGLPVPGLRLQDTGTIALPWPCLSPPGALQPSSSCFLCLCCHSGTIGGHRVKVTHGVTLKLMN